MKGYRFYSKNDSKKESHGVTKASSFVQATEFFAKSKDLSYADFVNLFIVEEYDRA